MLEKSDEAILGHVREYFAQGCFSNPRETKSEDEEVVEDYEGEIRERANTGEEGRPFTAPLSESLDEMLQGLPEDTRGLFHSAH